MISPLTPLDFLARSVHVWRDLIAVVEGDRRFTYAEFGARVERQAAALLGLGVQAGDRVAGLAPNGAMALEAHFAPMRIGAILVMLNTRLAAAELEWILHHCGAKVLLADPQLKPLIAHAGVPHVIEDYEGFLVEQPSRLPCPHSWGHVPVADENACIAINYPSGTTGHRGGADRLVPPAPGALQVSQARRVRPTAAHRHRQDPQERVARQGKGKLMNIQISREGPIAIVTLNRPERRNALSLELMLDLIAAVEEIGRNREIRAVILAAGGKIFCSGHDLGQMAGRDLNEYRQIFDVCTCLMRKLQSIPQPVIAEVQGIATAAGCQLVATCDLAIAAEEAAFATPGVKIGLFCTTPMVALTRAIGRKRAMQMLLTGEMVPARAAAEWGLINQAVPAADLPSATRRLAEQVAAASSLVVAIGKQAFYTQIDLDQQKAYAYAKEVMSMNALAADAQEGIGAFLGKRAPCWSGR